MSEEKKPFDWYDKITSILVGTGVMFIVALLLKWAYATAVPVFFPTAPMVTYWQALASLILIRFTIIPLYLPNKK